ncbi:helix-turn-helix domain-containing protein [Nocardioides sp. Root140]|uniref:helix-turn-helix domain-containing protein n=1 Tax=Nocardioides sp. Root140 TaxID=1736460 RepID=UPI0009EA0521
MLFVTGTVDEAAQALTAHKNTVRYRVNQTEELLGHEGTSRRRSLSSRCVITRCSWSTLVSRSAVQAAAGSRAASRRALQSAPRSSS